MSSRALPVADITCTQSLDVSCPWIQSTTRPPGSPGQLTSNILQKLDLRQPVAPTLQLAGRTALCLDNWAKVTNNHWVLDSVSGHRLELRDSPYQTHYPVTVAQQGQESLINQEVQILQNKGAVSEVPWAQTEEGFYSTLFLVPKKEGQYRPVINLRSLNRFMKVEHFKMEGMHIVRDLLQNDNWMTRLDLKDAHFAIPIHKSHQKYLRFRWKDPSFQFTSLPFGLSTAPRVFTKILRPVVRCLREMGIRCVIYLDDILIMSQVKDLTHQHTWATVDLLESLGFLVNYQKSVLKPAQEISFLGFVLNSKRKEVRLPQSKVSLIQQEARQLLSQERVSARGLASFIGKLSAAILAIYPAPLHYRSLQRLKHRALRVSNYDSQMTISIPAQQDLQWWIDHLGNWNGRVIQEAMPEIEIETDASSMGWGAYCRGDFTGGCWSQTEATLHINALELMAATFGVQAFCKGTQVKSVLLKTDNSTVVAYINKMGGTKSPILVQLAKDLWQWCIQREIHLKAQHLPGKLNFTADFLSRHLRDRSDWILDMELFSMINRRLGPLEIDLFATRFSTRLPRFVSWRPDPMAEATDAFLQDWSAYRAYAHPPWCLIARVLFKAQAQEATLVIVVPLWQTQAWFPQLVDMLVESPILLPYKPGIVEPSPNCDCLLMANMPQLITCKVSGCASKQQEFRRKLSTSSLHPGETKQHPIIILHGRSGSPGAQQQIPIPLQRICVKY